MEVNESVSLEINLEAPEDSWNGSIMRVDVTGMARDEAIMEFHFMIEVPEFRVGGCLLRYLIWR